MMGSQMLGRTWSRSSFGRTRGPMSTKSSAPWAVLGMVAAFAGGAVLGMMGGKKSAMSGEGETTWRMRRHHHHDLGSPACRSRHESGELAAPGATGERQDERNEGE